MKRIKCWWFGHVVEFNKCYGEPDYFCVECGKEIDYHTMVTCRGMRYEIVMWWRGVVAWFGPCEDCGGRFGRHDNSKTHLPF